MRLIRNHRQLVEHALSMPDRRARDIALDLIDTGLQAVLPSVLIEDHIGFVDHLLDINGQKFDLNNYDHIWLVGLGKASADMAKEFEKLLGDRITGGCVVSSNPQHLERVEHIVGGHPLPNEASREGAEKILTIARLAGEKDLVIALISGGGSALAESPLPGIQFDELRRLQRDLLLSGATVKDINTIRMCLSKIKGGGLLLSALPATLIGVLISDVVDNDLQKIASGPTIPRTKDFAFGMKRLIELGIWEGLSAPIKDQFRQKVERGDWATDDKIRLNKDKVFNFLLGSNQDALDAMQRTADKLGCRVAYMDGTMQGDAKNAGDALVRQMDQHRLDGDCVILFAGETTVQVRGSGEGGRNQELVLGCIDDLEQLGEGCAIAAIGSDGIDFAKVAGAIADAGSLARAEHMGMTPSDFLSNNDSFHFFEALEDHIKTGPTGTNVGDMVVGVCL